MIIAPEIQSRVRQLLGLRGGPAIEAIEAVQPVALIAGFPTDRQPQLESGDMLIRNWTGSASCTGLTAKFSYVGVRSENLNNVIWIRNVLITNTIGSAKIVQVGRTVNLTATGYRKACYDDVRLPFLDLSPAEVSIIYGNDAAFPTFLGPIIVNLPVSGFVQIPCDYILQGDLAGADNQLTVADATLAQDLQVGFQGVVFTRMR